MRLLLVEDEKKVADFVARGLRAERFAVDVAHDGDTGWKLASSMDYDLIVLDLMLPGMPGTQVAQQVRQLYPGVQILSPAAPITSTRVGAVRSSANTPHPRVVACATMSCGRTDSARAIQRWSGEKRAS